MLAYETGLSTDGKRAARNWTPSAPTSKARATARQLPEAVAKLQEFAKSSNASAPAALFAIGAVLAEDGEDDKAIGILESLLVAYAKSPWIPAANYQLGQLYARTGKTGQAIKALQSCIGDEPDPELVRTARFQLGHVLLNQTKDYAGAAAQFAPDFRRHRRHGGKRLLQFSPGPGVAGQERCFPEGARPISKSASRKAPT